MARKFWRMAHPVLIDIPHTLGRDEARRRLRDRIGELGEHIPGGAAVESNWPGDYRMNLVVKAVLQTVHATLDVEERNVRCELWLPAWLALFANRIKSLAREKGGELLLEDKHGGGTTRGMPGSESQR